MMVMTEIPQDSPVEGIHNGVAQLQENSKEEFVIDMNNNMNFQHRERSCSSSSFSNEQGMPLPTVSSAFNAEAATNQHKNDVEAGANGHHPNDAVDQKQPIITNWLYTYFDKWLGTKSADGTRTKSGPASTLLEAILGFLGSFIAIGILTWGDFAMQKDDPRKMLLIASFGASAVLLFASPGGALSQPRNLIGGHVIAAFIGVLVYRIIVIWIGWKDGYVLAAALSVSLSIFATMITGCGHPPSGASSLVAVTGSSYIHDIGFMYILQPVLSGALILLGVALIFNNLSPTRSYPSYWI